MFIRPRRPLMRAAMVGGTDIVAKLKELKELQDDGALTQDEFDAAKQKLLQS